MKDGVNTLFLILQNIEEINKKISDRSDDLLTPDQISREYMIPLQTVRKIFRDNKDLNVQRNLKPQRILRSEWIKYLSQEHE